MMKILNTIFIGLLVTFIIPALVLLFSAIHKNQKMENKLSEINKDIDKHQSQVMNLNKKLNNIRYNSNKLEEIAREKYNFSRKEETIYRFNNINQSYKRNQQDRNKDAL